MCCAFQSRRSQYTATVKIAMQLSLVVTVYEAMAQIFAGDSCCYKGAAVETKIPDQTYNFSVGEWREP